MALRLLAVDLPPLIRQLVAKALARSSHEGIFVDVPAGGVDIEALAFATDADAVVAALVGGSWPDYCVNSARRDAPPLFGLDCDDGDWRVREIRTVETLRSDIGLDAVTIDEFLRHALSPGDRAS